MPAIDHLYEYLGLFSSCFLAATVLPFSSEAILAGMLYAGYQPLWCLIVASIGNGLGGMTGYWIGWYGNGERIEKILRVKMTKVHAWEASVQRWGLCFALLCWLPFIGDFIGVVLGFFRLKVVPVAILMFLGKILRYAFVIFAVQLIV